MSPEEHSVECATPTKSVLYVGCPAVERPDAERQLAAANVSVVWADSGAYAVAELQRRDLPVLLDLTRGAAAIQVARELRDVRADALIFAVVDVLRPDLTTEAVLAGVADVFARPVGGRRIAHAIDRELGFGAPVAERRVPSDDLYSQSPVMREVAALVARAATMRAGVLVRGEDGTGRQVVARAIHAAQAHATGGFVCVDCAACDGDELDALLFGPAARGSADESTGRGLERLHASGRLYEARNGTVYLQNVADAPTRVQARLARVLRDREVLLVDTGVPTTLDVRPMAGVDPGFDAAVQEGRVRDDLFRRLSAIRIDMPPLRCRREDIPALANYFLRDLCASRHIAPKTLSRPALSLISALPWRGNAVELRTMLANVIADFDGARGIGLEDVLAHVRLDGGSVVFANGGTLRQARVRFEREYIAAVLEQYHGRISEAAKALGMQRTNLYRKLRALHVTRHDRRH